MEIGVEEGNGVRNPTARVKGRNLNWSPSLRVATAGKQVVTVKCLRSFFLVLFCEKLCETDSASKKLLRL